MILKLGADVCGIAHIDRFASAPKGFSPADLFPACLSVVVFGLALPKGIVKADPRFIYAHYNELICREVDRIALNAAKQIEGCFGGLAMPLPCDCPYEYWEADKLEGRGLISMKHAAMLAGLGTLGKNTLLLNAKYGNMLTIGAVLTNLELPSDELAQTICLEGCNLCLQSCPVQAMDGTSVDQKKCRPHTYGTTQRGFDTVECNRCRTVCPMRFGLNEVN
jgi:epoxyqueuosine reductase QueG